MSTQQRLELLNLIERTSLHAVLAEVLAIAHTKADDPDLATKAPRIAAGWRSARAQLCIGATSQNISV